MQSLPNDIVEKIFTRMSVTYGAAWAQMWGGLEDLSKVKAQWATELGGFAARPEAIQHALDHLPVDWPPNSLQFRVICMNAPEDNVPQLPGMPAQKADIGRLRANMERLAQLKAEREKRPKQWAYDLQQRERNGEQLTEQQRKDWRFALAHVSVQEMDRSGVFIEIPRESLPPAMKDEHFEQANRSLG